jgi:hypothetical protein
MITEKITWAEFRAMTFKKIAEIVEDSNCSNYTIIGYKYLDTKLVLHYRDCARVFLFEYNPIDDDHTNTDLNKQFSVTSFYTKDYSHEEYLEEVKHFSENYNRAQPEEK